MGRKIPWKWKRQPISRLVSSIDAQIAANTTCLTALLITRSLWIIVPLILWSAIVNIFWRTLRNMRFLEGGKVAGQDQRLYDERARKYISAIDSQEESSYRPVILFLRPFAIDKRVLVAGASSSSSNSVALETRLANACNEWATTVTLWNERDNSDVWGEAYLHSSEDKADNMFRGPGEVKVANERWFDLFASIARRADVIVSIPIDFASADRSSSTLLELRYLIESELLHKCIFFMPSEQSIFVPKACRAAPEVDRVQISALWKSSQASCIPFGLKLPDFDPDNNQYLTAFHYNHKKIKIQQCPQFSARILIWTAWARSRSEYWSRRRKTDFGF